MSEDRPRRLSESSRVEAFSDGVFSIAITLLVLELAIPAVNGKFDAELASEWVSYVAYLAAFGSGMSTTGRRRWWRMRSSAWRRASPGSCCSAIYRGHQNVIDPETGVHFFRLTEPLLTIVGYGISALIGWFISPAAALAIFLVFPALYVGRVRSAAR